MSELRHLRTKRDRHVFRLLQFARAYHGKPFLFLTLTTSKPLPNLDRKLARLLLWLRQKHQIEYLAVRTGEGNGVYHLALVSGYIHRTKIKKKWEKLTGAWNVHISMERSFPAFVAEMTGQRDTMRYSRSKNFVPKGSPEALEDLRRQVAYINRVRAYKQLARRLRKTKNLEESKYRTIQCVERFYGSYSDIKTRRVLYAM